jgi:transposase
MILMDEGRVWSVINIDTLDDRALFTDRSETRDYSAETKAVIPSNRSRRRRFRHDKALYRERNRIERCFNKLKHFRRLATRYDRRAVHYLAFLCLAAAMLWMR